MTTPPPPPGQPDWQPDWPATSQSAAQPQPAQVSQQSWWTGGRIAIAVVLVLVLTGGAGVAGFLAGLAVGSAEAVLEDVPGVTFGDDGGFVPGLTQLDVDAASGPIVGVGEQVAGTLTTEAIDHQLTLGSGQDVVITLASDDFDTVLVVLDAEGALVDSDDDGADTGTDSQLVLDLDAGTYTVRVQSWGGSGTGSYSLTVE